MPTGSRPRRSKPTPINLAEMEQDPGLRGMLSFLDVPPEERKRLLTLRGQRESQSPMGDSPTGLPVGTPVGEQPMGESTQTVDLLPVDPRKSSGPPEGEPPTVNERPGQQQSPTGELPMGQSPSGTERKSRVSAFFSPEQVEHPPYLTIPGIGRRRLHYCREVQDAHTPAEIVAYQALWSHAKRFGRSDSGGFIVDIGLSRLCELWRTDHKQAKRLLAALQEKQNIEVIREPNCQLGLATRYRVFGFAQILERRRARGLLWVVRTRATRFVPLDVVHQVFASEEVPMGESPMGNWFGEAEQPVGDTPKQPGGGKPEPPMGGTPADNPIRKTETKELSQETSSPAVARALREATGHCDDDAVFRLLAGCRAAAPDASDEEIAHFVLAQGARFRRMRTVENLMGLLITQVPKCFTGASFHQFRAAERQRREAEERQREEWRREAQAILDNPDSPAEEKEWARAELESFQLL